MSTSPNNNIPGDSEESPVGEPGGMGKSTNDCPVIAAWERADDDDRATSRGGVLVRSRGGRRGGAGLFCGVLLRDLVSTMMDYAAQFGVPRCLTPAQLFVCGGISRVR